MLFLKLLALSFYNNIHVGEIETVLNVGMNDQLVHALAAFTKSPRFAFDSYRRFIQSYGEHVLKVKESQYESIIKFALIERGVELVDDLSTYDLQGIINDFKNITKIPIDPWEQLLSIIEAVYQSWYAAPASMYRDTHEVSTHVSVILLLITIVYNISKVLLYGFPAGRSWYYYTANDAWKY